MAQRDGVAALQGTLDLIVLRALSTIGPLHAYALATRLEQISDHPLALNQGTLYPALVRLEQNGWIATKWGVSETNRKVKFYSLTKAGAKQLAVQVANWENAAAMVARILEAKS